MDIIKKIYGKILIPLAYYLRSDLRYRYLNEYRNNLHKTRSQIKKLQSDKLKKLVKHCYEDIDYYHNLFDFLGLKPEDIKEVSDLKKIPPLTKDIIRDNIDSLICEDKRKMEKCYSGGSTGNRVMLYKDFRYRQISRAVVLRDLSTVGLEPGDKVAWVWSAPFENESLKKNITERLLWKINRRIIFNALNYSDKELNDWLEHTFNRFKPDYIYGYANAIYDIALFIRKNDIKIHQVKKIICSAQKLEHRDFIEEVFNCKVIDHYGCREIDSIAIENDDYVMHSSDDFVIAELGDNNEILLTPLEAYGMPLLRYAVGDVGLPKKRKNDNYPFAQFALSVGRSCEILRNSKNERVHSAKINLEIARQGLDIGEFQLIQYSLDKVLIKIVKTKNTKKSDIQKMKDIVKKSLGTPIVDTEYVEKFPLEKSGKKIGYKCMIAE